MYVDHGSVYDVRYLTYRRSNEDSHFILPWADHAGVLESAMPFCSPSPDEMSKHRDSTVRLAHVLCRHAGYMIATKYANDLVRGNVDLLFSHITLWRPMEAVNELLTSVLLLLFFHTKLMF